MGQPQRKAETPEYLFYEIIRESYERYDGDMAKIKSYLNARLRNDAKLRAAVIEHEIADAIRRGVDVVVRQKRRKISQILDRRAAPPTLVAVSRPEPSGPLSLDPSAAETPPRGPAQTSHAALATIPQPARPAAAAAISAMEKVVLNFYLFGTKKKLRDAKRAEISEAADKYGKIEETNGHRCRWLRLISQSMPDGEQTAEKALGAKRIIELWAEAKNA